MAKITLGSLYLKHQDGALHEYSARRTTKLCREILAGRGGAEVTALTEAGYIGFLGESGEIETLEEGLEAYFRSKCP